MIGHRGVASLAVGVALAACSSSPPDPVPACSLLTAQDVSAAIGAPAGQGSLGQSVSDPLSDGCWFGSSKGFVSVWSKRADADAAYQRARALPLRQPQQAVPGTDYQAFTYTSPANLQEFHLLKNGDYIYIMVGAGASPGTAKQLGDLAVARLP